jgi:hypothetical protein
MTFKEYCNQLEEVIANSYKRGTNATDAESFAAQFLQAQIKVSQELAKVDMDSRTRKSGVKAVRAAVYLDIVQNSDKKPTEAQLSALVDTNDIVQGEQKSYDEAESYKEELERYYNIFRETHLFFRALMKERHE